MGGFDFSVLWQPQYRTVLISGALTTLQLAAGAMLGGLLLGAVIALARMSRMRLVSALATVFVEVTRTVPLLVHLLFWYFAVPELLPTGPKTWLYEQNVSFYCAMVALILYSAAFISEDLRSGIRSIPRGQTEAANSLGFGFFDTYRLVILPQALRATVPPLLGQAMTISKNTTVALMIGVSELAYVTRTIENATFQTVSVYVFTTVFFLLLAGGLTWLSQAYVRHAHYR